MAMKSGYVTILVTTKDKKEAQQIAKGLLSAKLIACANMIEGVQSMFWWEGKIDSAKETLLVLKTKQSSFKKVEAKVRLLHSYKVPEIIALPVLAGSTDYLKWIEDSLK